MPRRLVVAGIVITAVGLAMLAYLDPVIRFIMFGQIGAGTLGSAQFVRTGTPTGNFTGLGNLAGRNAGATSLMSVATIVVFVVAVIGLLLTIAGSFATGRGAPTGAGPSPAAKNAQEHETYNGALRHTPNFDNRY